MLKAWRAAGTDKENVGNMFNVHPVSAMWMGMGICKGEWVAPKKKKKSFMEGDHLFLVGHHE